MKLSKIILAAIVLGLVSPLAALADNAKASDAAHLSKGLQFAAKNRADQAVAEFDLCKSFASLSDEELLSVLAAYKESDDLVRSLPIADLLVERQKKAVPTASNKARARALASRAACYSSLSRYAEAARDYEQASMLGDTKAALWLGEAGEHYRRCKKFDKALACFDRCIAKAPNRFFPNLHRARCLIDQSRWAEAIPSFTKTIAICVEARKKTPDIWTAVYVEAYRGLANCYAKLGQLDKEKADRKELAALNNVWNDSLFGGQ